MQLKVESLEVRVRGREFMLFLKVCRRVLCGLSLFFMDSSLYDRSRSSLLADPVDRLHA